MKEELLYDLIPHCTNETIRVDARIDVKVDMIKGLGSAFAAILIWSGFIVVSRAGGISQLSPYDIIAIRYFGCALCVLPVWLFYARTPLLTIKVLISALVGGLLYALFTFIGFEHVSAINAGILLPGLMPIEIALLSLLINKERLTSTKVIGYLVISFGIAILIGDQWTVVMHNLSAYLAIFGATACWSLYTTLIQRWNISPWEATASLALISAGLYLPIYLIAFEKNLSFDLLNMISLQLVYQGFIATIVQMLLYVFAVRSIGPARVGSLMALVPIIAGLFAVIFLHEPINTKLIIAMLCVCFGVLIVNTPLSRLIRHKGVPT
ncbi:MAG: drug/metabolite transporter (DMT)-like permease [Flavobacteriales bacterium]|jgi:drug/metabolite transporter (DMT)-like permease